MHLTQLVPAGDVDDQAKVRALVYQAIATDRGAHLRPMRADRSVVLELAGIGAAALVFVATFQVRPPYLDFVLAAAAVALIVFSAARSRRLWALARSVDPTGARGARGSRRSRFTAAALLVLALAAVLVARAAGTPRARAVRQLAHARSRRALLPVGAAAAVHLSVLLVRPLAPGSCRRPLPSR